MFLYNVSHPRYSSHTLVIVLLCTINNTITITIIPNRTNCNSGLRSLEPVAAETREPAGCSVDLWMPLTDIS